MLIKPKESCTFYILFTHGNSKVWKKDEGVECVSSIGTHLEYSTWILKAKRYK